MQDKSAGRMGAVACGHRSTMTDLAWKLKRSGYRALPEDRHERAGGDTYVSRLLGSRALVVRGEAGVRFFYDEERVRRADAVPAPLAGLLFGRGAVHGLDDEAHRERKEIFHGLVTPDRVGALAQAAGTELARRTGSWEGRGEVAVHGELVAAYGAAVLPWAGIEAGASETRSRSRQLAAIVDGFGGAGRAYPRAWAARLRVDRWARGLVEEARAGRRSPAEGTALSVLAATDLPADVAGVELGNVVRPTVAVSWLGTFAALALAQRPDDRTTLARPAKEAERVAFAQEIRRTSPFVPALAGRVRVATRHDGIDLEPGDRVVLDVPGVNGHPGLWEHPGEFRPERFLAAEVGAFSFVPQGGGLPAGHRCPGEDATVAILAETVRVLAGLDLEVTSPVRVDLRRIPTLPRDGLRVRALPQTAPAR